MVGKSGICERKGYRATGDGKITISNIFGALIRKRKSSARETSRGNSVELRLIGVYIQHEVAVQSWQSYFLSDVQHHFV